MNNLTAGTVGKFALVLIAALVALKIIGWTLGILGALLGFLQFLIFLALIAALVGFAVLLLSGSAKKA